MSDDNQQATGTVSGNQLRDFINRIIRLEEEKTTIANQIKDIYGEAKGSGLDVKIMKKVISIMKDSDGNSKREEFESLLDTYLAAMGLIERD
jgi:uncharacterized protein (UPF0335 family)